MMERLANLNERLVTVVFRAISIISRNCFFKRSRLSKMQLITHVYTKEINDFCSHLNESSH